jgi:hypothetical protein
MVRSRNSVGYCNNDVDRPMTIARSLIHLTFGLLLLALSFLLATFFLGVLLRAYDGLILTSVLILFNLFGLYWYYLAGRNNK